jgi:S-adenosylmethionine uptake transporter
MQEGFSRSFSLVINSIPALIYFTFIMVKRHGFHRAYYTQYKFLHFIRSICLIGITFFAYEALSILPLSDFYGIVFSSPFVLTIGAFFIFKEKVNITEWAVIILGFIGVMVIVNPSYGAINIGYIYGILGVFCGATAGLIVRKIGREENTSLYVIFGNIAIIIANIIPAIQSALPPIEFMHYVIMITYSITVPLAVLTISAVYARAPSVASVAPMQYSQIIWGVILGYLVFNNLPTLNTIIGTIIVIGCGLYITLYHKRKRRNELI